MNIMFAEHELHNSCQVLFGNQMQASRGFLEYLQLSGIKSAYRQKAMETHPDRSKPNAGVNKSPDLFLSVQRAYENLCCYVNARTKGCSLVTKQATSGSGVSTTPYHSARKPHQTGRPRYSHTYTDRHHGNSETKQPNTARQRQTAQPRTSPSYSGSIPNRKLLFGHYLYYSGITNWQTITQALVWQRTKRPRIGELGSRCGWLSSKDILNILKNRSKANTFGKSALDLGLLTKAQLNLLIGQQNRLQRKFGEYFIAKNLLSPTQIAQLVRQFRIHNFSVIVGQAAHRTM
jgi:hypothetical protein